MTIEEMREHDWSISWSGGKDSTSDSGLRNCPIVRKTENFVEEFNERSHMKLWYIWGLYLPVLLIEADSFDNALEKARRINPNYNTGLLRENIHSHRIYYGMYGNISFDYLDPSTRKSVE